MYCILAGWKVSSPLLSLQCTGTDRRTRTIYTGGSDTLVKLWAADGDANQEPDSAVEAQEAVTCVATNVSSIVYTGINY